jgi:hypothetical protein
MLNACSQLMQQFLQKLVMLVNVESILTRLQAADYDVAKPNAGRFDEIDKVRAKSFYYQRCFWRRCSTSIT